MKAKITILALHLGAGGAERVVANISNILCEFCDVNIISTYQISDKPAFEIDDRVKITYLMEPGLSPNKEALKKAIKERKVGSIFREGFKSIKILYLRKHLMIKAIKALDSDIAISTRVLHSNWLGKYGAKNIIKIAQEHNHHQNDPKIIRSVVQSLEHIDYFMPTSKYLADFYGKVIEEQHLRTKVCFIPNCLPKLPEELADINCKNMIAVGRLEQEKGFLDLIDLFHDVHKTLPDWTLSIVGDGSQREELKAKIAQLNLDDVVKLKGLKVGAELDEEYKNSSLYLMTSYTESFGLVLLEAESYGIPLIAFDSAEGAKELIENGRNGFLIASRQKDAILDKISELANHVELRTEMGRNGRKMAERYSRETVSDEWKSFITDLQKH